MIEQPPDNKLTTETPSDTVPWTTEQTFLGLFLTVVPWLLLSFGLNAIGSGTTTTQTQPLSLQADIASAITAILFSVIVEGAFLIAPIYMARRTLRATNGVAPTSRQVLGALGFRGFRVREAFFWIVLFMIGLILVNYLYQYLITALHLTLQTNDQVYMQNGRVAPIATYAILFTAVFIAPFCEEVFFRGFVFPGLRRGMALGWAIVLSALIFAAVHADIGSFAVLAIIGLALAFLRWRTRSIWPGMALHMLNNTLGALSIVLYMHGIGH